MIVKRSSIPDVTTAAENRGKRESSNVGGVRGSDAGAGGGGGPEEHASDPQAGSGKSPAASPPPKSGGADATAHGSR